jgi:hypothetical protein
MLPESLLWIVFKTFLALWFATGWRWTKSPFGWAAGKLAA